MALETLTARDVMKTTVKRIHPDETLSKALSMLEGIQDVLIVEEDGEYKGVITERRIIRSGLDPSTTKVRSVLVHAPTVTPDTLYPELVRLIIDANVMDLPVSAEGRIIGIVDDDVLLTHLAKDELAERTRVEDLMTPEPVIIHPRETIAKALSLFRQHGISRLPVVEKNRLAGIVTLHDILTKAFRPRERPDYGTYIAEKESIIHLPVEDIMEKNVATATPDTRLKDAVSMLVDRAINSLIVVDDEDYPIGMLTRRDVFAWLNKRLKRQEHGVTVQLSMDKSLKEEGEAAILTEAERFIEKYADILGTGVLYVYVTRHKEKFRGLPAIFTRLRLLTDRFTIAVHAHGWGYEQSMKNALRKVEDQIFSRKEYFEQLRKRKKWVEEWLAFYDIPSI